MAGTTHREDRKRREEKLDKAIRDTFPASDPPASGRATSTEPSRRPKDRQPPEITKEQIDKAQRGDEQAQNDSIKRRR
jgi:hypothetical protein